MLTDYWRQDIIMDSYTIVVNLQETSIDKIDEQIRSLQQHIQELRATRNALVPISRLPPDVLLSIFSSVKNSCSLSDYRLSLLSITWVSRNWRMLAVGPGSASLWTTISMNWKLGWSTWVARSGSAPLSITLTHEKPGPVSDRLKCLSAQMHRVKTLAFSCYLKPSDASIFQHLMATPTSMLTSMELDSMTLPMNFSPQVPNLESMVLTRCKLIWENGVAIFPSLESLRVVSPKPALSVGQVIGLIYSAPSLRHLMLDDLFPFRNKDEEPTPDPSPAPGHRGPVLDTLNLNSRQTLQPALQFLKYAIPRFTNGQTTVWCKFNLKEISNNTALPDLVSSLSHLWSLERVISLIMFEGRDGLTIKYHGLADDICRTTLVIAINGSQLTTLRTAIQPRPAIMHLRALKVDHFDSWGVSQLLEMFGWIPSLEYFVLSRDFHTMNKLLGHLLPTDTCNPSKRGSMPFPALKVFGAVSLRDVHDQLVEVFGERRRLGYGLETLVARDSRGSDTSKFSQLTMLVDRIANHASDADDLLAEMLAYA